MRVVMNTYGEVMQVLVEDFVEVDFSNLDPDDEYDVFELVKVGTIPPISNDRQIVPVAKKHVAKKRSTKKS